MNAVLQKGSPSRLDRVIGWSALSLALFAPKVYSDAMGGAGWRAWIFFAAIVLHVANLLWCRRLLRRGEFGRALRRTLWGSLLMFSVGAAHSDNNPSTAVLPVLLAAMALPHLDEKPFIRYALMCLAALLLNLLVAALWPMQVSESPAEAAAGHIFATSAAAGVAMLLFWQIKFSLQKALEAKTRARAEALVEEERYRQVLEGTGDGFWLLSTLR